MPAASRFTALDGMKKITVAWLIATGWLTVLIAIRAHRPDVDPLMWPLLLPVWLVCLGVVIIGTYRVTSLAAYLVLRLLLTSAGLAFQGYCFFYAVVAITIYVHFLAGGTP